MAQMNGLCRDGDIQTLWVNFFYPNKRASIKLSHELKRFGFVQLSVSDWQTGTRLDTRHWDERNQSIQFITNGLTSTPNHGMDEVVLYSWCFRIYCCQTKNWGEQQQTGQSQWVKWSTTVLVLHVQYSKYRLAKYSFVVKTGVGKFNYLFFFYVTSRKSAKSSPGPLGPPPLACIPYDSLTQKKRWRTWGI